MKNKLKLKKGDEVIVITGKDKGKTGKIAKIFPDIRKAIVSGINKVITVSSQHFDNQSFENNTCFISISLEDISLLQKK